jgi:hypothetical protein
MRNLGHYGNFWLIGLHADGKFLARGEITDINLSVRGNKKGFLFLPEYLSPLKRYA